MGKDGVASELVDLAVCTRKGLSRALFESFREQRGSLPMTVQRYSHGCGMVDSDSVWRHDTRDADSATFRITFWLMPYRRHGRIMAFSCGTLGGSLPWCTR